MTNGEKLYFSLSLLLDIAEEVQDLIKEEYYFHRNKQWLKEFCVVHAGTARGGGHDWAVSELLRKRFQQSLIISPSHVQAENARKEYLKHISLEDARDCKHRFVGASTYNSVLNNCRGIQFDSIIIQGYSQMSASFMDKLYDFALPFAVRPLSNNERFFILLVH